MSFLSTIEVLFEGVDVAALMTDIAAVENGAQGIIKLADAGAVAVEAVIAEGKTLYAAAEVAVKAVAPKAKAELEAVTKGAIAELKTWLAARVVTTTASVAEGEAMTLAMIHIS